MLLEISSNAELSQLFPVSDVVHISPNGLPKVESSLKDIKLCVIHSGPFNGSTIDLIKRIRKDFTGCMIILVNGKDADLGKKFLEAGASDILYDKEATKENIIQVITRYNKSHNFDKALEDIKINLTNLILTSQLTTPTQTENLIKS